MVEIIRENGETAARFEDTAGKTLLELLRERQVYIDAPCAGKGSCGRCRVRYLNGAPEATDKEKNLLTQEEIGRGVRLACAVYPQDGCRIELPSQREEQIAALINKTNVDIKKQAEPDTERRNGHAAAAYGAAIDIGTTTLAASLIELKSGRRVGVTSRINHQRAYGADVISRIQAANEGAGALMQQSICADIDCMLRQLVTDAGIAEREVGRIVIVGNTTMCHLLRGLSCAGLGASPFVPEDISMWEGSAAELPGLAAWNAEVTILPGISAFVGADIVAGIYACGMAEEEACLLLDIGTNGEMAVGGRDGFLVTSAAAGPVFEGGGILCGMPGVPGAVTRVSMERCRKEDMVDEPDVSAGKAGTADVPGENMGDDSDMSGGKAGTADVPGENMEDLLRTVVCETIGGKDPVGLCGTGIISVTGELVRLGLVDENGTLSEPWFSENVPVAGEEVYFSEQDIRQVQMGKAAIRAGIETLLAEYPGAAVSKIYIAGGFGCELDIEQAIRIGMFPKSFSGRVEMIGNSALEGAEKFLTQAPNEAKAQLEGIVSHAKEIGLAMHPRFNELYLESMFF